MNKPRNERPTAAEFTALRTWLVAQGFTNGQVGQMIGTTRGTRTREAITDALRAGLAVLEKRR